MKKRIIVLVCTISFFSVQAQRCLDIKIASLMNVLKAPANAGQALKECTTSKNTYGMITISDYGTDQKALDTLISRTTVQFSINAVPNGMAGMHAPNQAETDAAKDLATTLQSMTPEQQKEWAMQVAKDKMANPQAASGEDPSNMRLVMETHDMSIRQFDALNNEFSAALTALDNAADQKIHAVAKGDKSKCPTNQVGMYVCSCTNALEAKYWKQVVEIRDNYNAQKLSVYQNYIPKIQSLVTSIDNNVARLKNGDLLKTDNAKRMLYSAQSSSFARAFLITSQCVAGIRKTGADASVNKLNSDNNLYDVSCSK